MFSRLSPSTRIVVAFASVYLFWGSTYVAIHVAGEHLPVPVVSATRSVISAVLIAVIAAVRGISLRVPKREPWKLVLIGLLIMSANNMLLTWGETMVPSGFASLIICTIPIMIGLMETVLPGGDALNGLGWAGTLIATLGIAVLVWPSLHAAHGGHDSGAASSGFSRPLAGTLAILGAALAFAVASVLSRRFQFKADTFVATGWQLGSAGIFNVGLALATGGFRRAHWTWHGFGSIVYLSVFGSLCGLVAFTYLLKNVAVTKVATYAFVNPVIAVLLGVALLGERLSPTEVMGMAVILCGVAMVVFSHAKRPAAEPEPA